MGMIKRLGSAKRDDPMFSSGPEMFLRCESRPYSSNPAKSTDGVKPAPSASKSRKPKSERENEPNEYDRPMGRGRV